MPSSSATSIPTTSSTSSRSGTTCSGTSSRRDGWPCWARPTSPGGSTRSTTSRASRAASLDIAESGRRRPPPLGPFRLEARLVRHTEESYAFRVTAGDGPGLVYSGDCGDAADLRPLIRPGDTLLCEASFGTDPVADGSEHLNAFDVGRAGRRDGVAGGSC